VVQAAVVQAALVQEEVVQEEVVVPYTVSRVARDMGTAE